MPAAAWRGSLAAVLVAAAIAAADGQIGGKPVSGGNPTPGTPQPAPPDLRDRIALTGCLQAAPGSGAEAPDPNTPSDSRFVLVDAERLDRVPPGTGGSALAAGASGRRVRLEGLDSLFTPFVGAKVEISGEVRPAPASAASGVPPTLLVEFVQRIAPRCG
jgi:hypothetical protein